MPAQFDCAKANGWIPMTDVRVLFAANLLAIVLLSACVPVQENELKENLRKESIRSGLAIVQIRGNGIGVTPFDGEERFFQAEYSEPVGVAIGKTGSMAAWYSPPFIGKAELLVTDGNGQPVLRHHLIGSDFAPVALSETSRRLAFVGSVPRDDSRVGLHWMSLDSSAAGFVDTDVTLEVDWSPDGQRLVYEKNGEIFVFDLSTNSSRSIGFGHDPTWCPDGERLAFRGLDGRSGLRKLDGSPVSWPFGSMNVHGAIRWSPDGRFVMLAVPMPSSLLSLGARYGLVVGRVSDGVTMKVREFGGIAPDYHGFRWIVDYPSFFSQCKRGHPFN